MNSLLLTSRRASYLKGLPTGCYSQAASLSCSLAVDLSSTISAPHFPLRSRKRFLPSRLQLLFLEFLFLFFLALSLPPNWSLIQRASNIKVQARFPNYDGHLFSSPASWSFSDVLSHHFRATCGQNLPYTDFPQIRNSL